MQSKARDCYEVAKHCADCARERVKLPKNKKLMKLCTHTAPLEYVAIKILGKLFAPKRGKHYVLVISDLYSKVVPTEPLRSITFAQVALEILLHLMFVNGPSVKLLSDKATQFKLTFFQNVDRTLEIRKIFITTSHPQTYCQVERFNSTLLSALRKYIGDRPK